MNAASIMKIVIENARELLFMPLVGEMFSTVKMFSTVSMSSKFIKGRAISVFLPYGVAKNIKRII